MHQSLKNIFSGKKITLMGLGLLGRGIGVAQFLAECGAILTITDLKTKEQLASSLLKLKKFKNITYVLGEHRLEDFKNKDMVVKAAGVPLDSLYIAEAKKHNIPVEMDSSLFVKLLPKGVTTIGVTGTRGKTTVTHLIFEILKTAKKRVYFGGNIEGLATLPLIKKIKSGDYIVMELDSWQLQGFGDAKLSPHVAVFTNFMRDHQNYYKNDMDRYFADKTNIYLNQTKEDFLICGEAVSKKNKTRSHKIIAKKSAIPESWKVKLKGEHNRQNTACAYEAGKVLAISQTTIKKAIETFSGVSGRLQFIRSWKGKEFYNDATATTPDATKAALNALKHKNIILIAGGNDKNLDFTDLAKQIPKKVKALVLFSGAATEKIKKALPKNIIYTEVSSMKDALAAAIVSSQKGDVVLLSPGATSFGIFKNEYDRRDQFTKLVKGLR
jgi:UDP-N-acetylmuramoylalanine--D-glutamate ligase